MSQHWNIDLVGNHMENIYVDMFIYDGVYYANIGNYTCLIQKYIDMLR